MRWAEARRRASTISTSSIRLSLVGAQVDCRMKTSLPRTFSLISTAISPSLNCPTVALPRRVSRLSAILRASSGLAFPAKTINFDTRSHLCSVGSSGVESQDFVEGRAVQAAGLEGRPASVDLGQQPIRIGLPRQAGKDTGTGAGQQARGPCR